ncbi:MAG TPA: hypothetical protein VGE10_11125 [Zeimonas sp.]
MAASAVSICSAALDMLGADPINSLTDPGTNAGRCARAWPLVRDWLLRKHSWNAAVKRVVLAPDAVAPAFGFGRAFTLPADFLRVLEVGDDDTGRPAYKLESGKILAEVSALRLRYVWRNDNPATWDSAMVHVATLAIAARLAYAITNSASVEEIRIGELRDELQAAKSIDGVEEDGDVLGDFPLYAARF